MRNNWSCGFWNSCGESKGDYKGAFAQLWFKCPPQPDLNLSDLTTMVHAPVTLSLDYLKHTVCGIASEDSLETSISTECSWPCGDGEGRVFWLY